MLHEDTSSKSKLGIQEGGIASENHVPSEIQEAVSSEGNAIVHVNQDTYTKQVNIHVNKEKCNETENINCGSNDEDLSSVKCVSAQVDQKAVVSVANVIVVVNQEAATLKENVSPHSDPVLPLKEMSVNVHQNTSASQEDGIALIEQTEVANEDSETTQVNQKPITPEENVSTKDNEKVVSKKTVDVQASHEINACLENNPQAEKEQVVSNENTDIQAEQETVTVHEHVIVQVDQKTITSQKQVNLIEQIDTTSQGQIQVHGMPEKLVISLAEEESDSSQKPINISVEEKEVIPQKQVAQVEQTEISPVELIITDQNVNAEEPLSSLVDEKVSTTQEELEISDVVNLSTTETKNPSQLEEKKESSVIEISEDGTWETRTLPPKELEVEANGSGVNLGAQIMQKYEEERQKLRENLPDVSLLDVDASLEDIQQERRRIIDNQTVRAKRIDSWIKTEEGEVVYDSIIENKHKTKSYWEQLMMAAAASEQARGPYKRDLLSLGSDGEDGKPSSDISEQEYYDARSHVSLQSPAEPLDSLDQSYGPKIVETVAKKLLEAENAKHNKTSGDESVIEREIRLQREREQAVAREREEALLKATSAETKIALELREMREREEELRRLRQRLVKDEPDDGFNSIPNTDEGNFSEYGSEEKEGNSRMMSPEVPAGLHQRTQSLDSMSSGHSSGSGSGDLTVGGRRRVTVKPLDEPEEDEVANVMLRNRKETPIEREIRLAKEREEELRREKRLPPQNSQTTTPSGKQEVRKTNSRNPALANDPRSMQHRLATSRIQQEIDEATEREKELREAGMIQTMSEETVDSKVTRFTDLAEFTIKEHDRKFLKSNSTPHIEEALEQNGTSNSLVDVSFSPPPASTSTPENNVPRYSLGRSSLQNHIMSLQSPRKFPMSMGQKGLMQRFLASRGKMGTLSSGFVNTPTTPTPLPYVPPRSTEEKQDVEEKQNGDILRSPFRKGYISAEEKIQVELQEMQKREEELRLQRARIFARSQPNLLSIRDDEIEENEEEDRETENHIPLRSALSNPNLLDSETTNGDGEGDSSLDKPLFRTLRKRSALIAQWENMIQKNTEN